LVEHKQVDTLSVEHEKVASRRSRVLKGTVKPKRSRRRVMTDPVPMTDDLLVPGPPCSGASRAVIRARKKRG
jgi:hypothetical protein